MLREGPAEDLSVTFDETAYLEENPDVAFAIARGDVASGYAHFLKYGLKEGREPPPPRDEPRQRIIRFAPREAMLAPAMAVSHYVEALVVSRGGGLLVVGWLDDAADPIDALRISCPGWRATLDGPSLARARRRDVEAALGGGLSHPYGFLGLLFASGPIAVAGECRIELVLSSGRTAVSAATPRLVEDLELRDLALSQIASADHFGNPHVQAIAGLGAAIGDEVVRLNRHVTDALIASPYVERFGRSDRAYDGSLVICLYGKAEFLFLQAALFGAVQHMDRYELIFVSNSPELSEVLLREARVCVRTYGLDIQVVILPGNAGFGAANNVGVRVARSDRILIVNPDVFPMDRSWAQRHAELVAAAPADQTRLFGSSLYYDDGSLMHGGMYFELDRALSMAGERHRVCQLMRVEHYGKGTPAGLPDFVRPRPVPAVTGAFISCARDWFETLGGFTHDYVFGHYEDADLCLKSLSAGVAPWLHDLKLWHLEGKGSTRLPVHEGGSLVNRWLFSATWGGMVTESLLGPDPAHPLIRRSPAGRQRALPASRGGRR